MDVRGAGTGADDVALPAGANGVAGYIGGPVNSGADRSRDRTEDCLGDGAGRRRPDTDGVVRPGGLDDGVLRVAGETLAAANETGLLPFDSLLVRIDRKE